MGEAVLAGALSAGWAAADVVATVRTEARAQHLRETYQVATTSDNVAAVRGAGLVLVAVKPKDVGALLDVIAPGIDASAVVVTVAAGHPASFYEERLPAGTAVVRTVPNTPAAIGAGITAIAPGAAATEAHLEAVEHLLAGTGTVVRAAEKDALGVRPRVRLRRRRRARRGGRAARPDARRRAQPRHADAARRVPPHGRVGGASRAPSREGHLPGRHDGGRAAGPRRRWRAGVFPGRRDRRT
jgi:hypothetical protein